MSTENKKALVVIDIQYDYFSGGLFPLFNTQETLDNIINTIRIAKSKNIPVVLVQHIVDAAPVPKGFFFKDTEGAKIHKDILAAAGPEAPIVVKAFADSYLKTNLGEILDGHQVQEVLYCGMMTQNCVGLSAISESAKKYKNVILSDCSTSPTEMVHLVALAGFGQRATVQDSKSALN
eukprot:gene7942-9771_t